MVIRVLGGFRKRFGKIGDIVVVLVKEVIFGGNVKKGDIVKVVIVRIRKEIRRDDGLYIKFDDNVGVVINNNNELRVIRIFGLVVRELRVRNFMKILFLVIEVI